MSALFVIRRSLAITSVNAYYEIKKEGNNQENEDQFKKNFVKFIVPYMNNTYFTEEIAECLFMAIATLENEKEEYYTSNVRKCEQYYNYSPREIGHLFLSVRNYHLLNGIKSRHFDPTKELMDIIAVNDSVIEENDCYICKWHGYDINWPNNEERGKFYYSIPGNINQPICESCVKTNCLDIKETTHVEEDESEIYGTVAYLRKYGLIKCENCSNIWDGCAQCNCWQWNDYVALTYKTYIDETDMDKNPADLQQHNKEESVRERYHNNIDAMFASWKEEDKQEELYMRPPPPDRPAPLPRDKKIMGLEEKIALLEEENKNLLEEITHLKHLVNNS